MSNRLDHVDGMRGIAALLVLFQHCLEKSSSWADFPQPILETLNIGRFGVLLFFLISGFVIPFSLKGQSPIRNFAISRAARLLPALWMAIAALYVLKGPYELEIVLANMAMVAWPFEIELMALAFWSLSCELGFYFFCGFAFFTNILRNSRVVGSIAMLLLVWSFIFFNDPLFFLVFLLAGLLLRLWLFEHDEIAKPWAIAVCIGITLVAANFYRVPASDPFFQPLARALAAALPVPVFIAVVTIGPRTPGWLLWLGTVSYSVYIFQDFSLTLLLPYAGLSPVLFIAAVAALTLCIAAASYKFIEAPFVAFGRRINRQLAASDEQRTARQPLPGGQAD